MFVEGGFLSQERLSKVFVLASNLPVAMVERKM